MDNPTLAPQLRWTEDRADARVKIDAYRRASAIAGVADADARLIVGVNHLIELSHGQPVSDYEA